MSQERPRRSLALLLYVIGIVQMCALLAPAILFMGPAPKHHHGFHAGIPPPILNFLCGFVVIAVGSYLTSRWLMRPLKGLSRAAQALGSGDLRARADTSRSDEIGAVGEAFNEMAERMQALLLAEKELLANVSHELRTPLARIRVALALAEQGDAQNAKTSLEEIAIDLEELEGMLDDIFVASRVAMLGGAINAAAGFSLKLVQVTPERIATRAADLFRKRHPSRVLKITIEDGLPELRADAVLLRRAVDNLLDNADKYSATEDAHVELRVFRAVRPASDDVHDAQVSFEVVDRGDGIPDADLPKLFEPFFRGAQAGRTQGIGLGLTLVKRIVQAHDGTIELRSAAGQGTRACVTLPCKGPSEVTVS